MLNGGGDARRELWIKSVRETNLRPRDRALFEHLIPFWNKQTNKGYTDLNDNCHQMLFIYEEIWKISCQISLHYQHSMRTMFLIIISLGATLKEILMEKNIGVLS